MLSDRSSYVNDLHAQTLFTFVDARLNPMSYVEDTIAGCLESDGWYKVGLCVQHRS